MHVDDVAIVTRTEDDPVYVLYKEELICLARMCEEYHLKISEEKIMVFIGIDPIRSKSIVNNKIIGQVSHLNCIGVQREAGLCFC